MKFNFKFSCIQLHLAMRSCELALQSFNVCACESDIAGSNVTEINSQLMIGNKREIAFTFPPLLTSLHFLSPTAVVISNMDDSYLPNR